MSYLLPMMRVTVKGVVLGGSVGVLLTTALLWSQCHTPAPSSALGQRAFVQRTQQETFKSAHLTQENQNDVIDESSVDDYVGVVKGGRPPKGGGGRNELRSPIREDGGHGGENPSDRAAEDDAAELHSIPCLINGETTISCRRDASEVFIPFSFIHNYFEVYGDLGMSASGGEVFEWSHSYSHAYEPRSAYSPTGLFLNFHLFNVEARERVKCVSAITGVPISTQWQSSGYPYPIQIAQFGLSHYNKYLEDPTVTRVMIENGYSRKAKWKVDSGRPSFKRSFNDNLLSYVLSFDTQNRDSVTLKYGTEASSELLVLSTFLQLDCKRNSSLTVGLRTQSPENKKTEMFYLHYYCSNTLIEVKGDQHIYYGLGMSSSWRFLTRNLLVDLMKGVAASKHAKKMKKRATKGRARIFSISLRGSGLLRNLSLARTEHLRHVYDAADWLVREQDDKGGWSISVHRKVIAGVLELKPGWYSAMAQGQAISLLVRAAHISSEEKYLKAAIKATQLMNVNVSQGGVRTYFPGGMPWYEEYPTTPSMYVLNGFMYSLFGLYDLSQAKFALPNLSSRLFSDGLVSLVRLLPFFDTGQGSMYDLRHFTTHVAPNIARWDYHTTHVTQLLALATVVENEEAQFLVKTATRWKEYLVGRRARHN